jgi:YVTN family beta-propeller protein
VATVLAALGLTSGMLLAGATIGGASTSWTGFVANGNDSTLSVLSSSGPSQQGSPVSTGSDGADPSAVAVDGSQAFVANYGDNSVGVFNTASDSLVATIPVGTNPVGVAVSPDGTKVLVANAYDSTVSVINAATDAVTATVPLPSAPTAITIGTVSSTPTAYVVTAASILPLALNTLTVGTAIPLPATLVGATSVNPQGRAGAITPDGSTVYVADFASGEVDAIATATSVVTQIPTGNGAGSEPAAVAVGTTGADVFAYVANYGEGTITAIAEGSTTPTTFSIGSSTSGPDGIAVTPDGDTAVVVDANTGSAQTISLNTTATDDAVTGSTTVGSGSGSGPSAVAFPPAFTSAPTLAITAPTLPPATIGVPYSAPLSALGGVGPISWSATTVSGSLASIGLSLSPSGLISGTPTSTGPANFTVTATDSTTPTAQTATSNTLNIAPSTISITTPTTLPNGAQGSVYPGVTLAAAGGVAPYTWSGTLPFGLSLNPSTGAISGTPTSSGGPSTFTIGVTDSTPVTPLTTSELFSLTVGSTISVTPSALPSTVVGTTFTANSPLATVVASGGTGPFTYALSAGTLPPGLALNTATGAITGLVSGAGSFPVSVLATDAASNTATQVYSSFSVYGMTTSSIPTAFINEAYTTASPLATLTVNGGTGPYTWTSTALPAGLTLNASTGAITGTPTVSAVSTAVTFTVTDSSGTPLVASSQLTVPVSTTPITATTATGQQNANYTTNSPLVQLTATGGNGTYAWSIVSGTLPSGLVLGAGNGDVTGSPTTLGSTPVVFAATDTETPTPDVSHEQVTFNIEPSQVTVTTTSLPSGTAGTAYSATLAASGGVGAPYTWVLASGSLPQGLNLSSAGVISGTPTAVGSPAATFTATDGSSDSGTSGSLTITINPAAVVTPPPPPVTHGYWLVGSDGGIFTFGSAVFHGSTGNLKLQRPVVGITPTTDEGGYWLVASDGGIFSFGDSGFYGSIPGLGLAPAGTTAPKRLNAPIVGMVPSQSGNGYFMVASDGGVFAFGDAQFEGSCPGIGGCSGAAVGVAPDGSGKGYWLVTATGHIYTFGDAPYFGAPGPQSSTITSIVRTPSGNGYWILDADGQVFAYGNAPYQGSLPSGAAGSLNPAAAIFATSDGGGYWISTALGKIYTFGDAPNDGDMSGTHLNGSIIAGTGY